MRGLQAKSGSDARSAACSARKRLRTPIRHRHAGLSSLKLPQLVNVDRQLAPVDRDDHAEADADLAGRDGHHDQRKDLTIAVTPHAREGDQREVGAVEHQLQAKQHDQRVAARHDAEGAEREDDRRDGEIPADAHWLRLPTPSAIVPVPWGRSRSSGVIALPLSSSSRPPRRRASTTAPTAAISSRKEATSKASRKRVSSSLPMKAGGPSA